MHTAAPFKIYGTAGNNQALCSFGWQEQGTRVLISFKWWGPKDQNPTDLKVFHLYSRKVIDVFGQNTP